MSALSSVKISSRHQISIPSYIRKSLQLDVGDRLLVDLQDGVIILIPQPQSFAEGWSGLYQEIWRGVDSDQYILEERAAWHEDK